MTFNSDEINFLVYRYLEESGFHHSAYTFSNESSVVNAGIEPALVPRGALMSLLQKGMLFAEAEVLALVTGTTDGVEIEQKFEKTIGSMSLIESTMPETLRQKAMDRKLKDDHPSQTCSPHPGTSSSTANPTSQTSTLTNNHTISAETLVMSSLPTAVPSTSDGSAMGFVSASHHSSANLSQAKTGLLPPVSSTPILSANERVSSSPMIVHGSRGASGSPSLNPCYRSTPQRERDFRALQTSTIITSPSGPVPGLPPRGAYRTTPQGQEHIKNASAGCETSSTQPANLVVTPSVQHPTSSQPLQRQYHHQLTAPSNVNSALMDNGLHIHHQPLNVSVQSGQGIGVSLPLKQAQHVEMLGGAGARLLAANGTYSHPAGLASTLAKKTLRLDGSPQLVKGAPPTASNNGNSNSGSVFNSPYCK